jgi:hypothetical protein
MAFRQYTTCVKPDKFVNVSVTYRILTGLVAAILAGLVTFVTSPVGVAIGYGLIVLLIALISFLYWWLNGRLICLSEEEKCIIGVVLGRPSVQPLKKAGDDDASINVVLAPSPVNLDPKLRIEDTIADPKEVYWNNPIQGAIVTPQDSVLALGRGYVSDAEHDHYLKAIHSEFEGSGIDNLLKWAVAVLAILIAAMILSAIPGLGWLGLILKILAALIALIAAYVGLFDPLNPGDPNDVNPNIGELARGDIVVIKGDWVYDSLHDGWNEIHAIHACQKIGIFDLANPKVWPALFNGMPIDTPDAVKAARDFWCDEIRKAEDAEDGGNRDDPAQNWVVHPLVDGCRTTIIT